MDIRKQVEELRFKNESIVDLLRMFLLQSQLYESAIDEIPDDNSYKQALKAHGEFLKHILKELVDHTTDSYKDIDKLLKEI